MSGKNPPISHLELRKQLLLAESELNRAQLVEELETVADGVRSISHRAKSLGLIVSSTAMLVGAFAAFRRGKPVEAGPKQSLLQSILNGVSLIAKLLREFHSQDRDQTET